MSRARCERPGSWSPPTGPEATCRIVLTSRAQSPCWTSCFSGRRSRTRAGCRRGHVQAKGYGTLTWRGRSFKAHRASYELFIGPIAPGFEIDHLCRVRHCVNPDHMESVTHEENIARAPHEAYVVASWLGNKTHCPQGHEYDEANTYFYRGSRHCRVCKLEATRRWVARQRSAA